MHSSILTNLSRGYESQQVPTHAMPTTSSKKKTIPDRIEENKF